MALCLAGALAASVYVISVLEILKLKRVRGWQMVGLRGPQAPPPDEAEVEAGVEHELDTGTFAAVDPSTGEMRTIDPDTGEMDAVSRPSR
jgi:UDP-GlcNAc:undecaprenyl-phosphate GlcNAc-1-phosphate transferase